MGLEMNESCVVFRFTLNDLGKRWFPVIRSSYPEERRHKSVLDQENNLLCDQNKSHLNVLSYHMYSTLRVFFIVFFFQRTCPKKIFKKYYWGSKYPGLALWLTWAELFKLYG